MRILSIVFAILSIVFVSAGIAHQSTPTPPVVPSSGPTPICPARHCAVLK